MNNEFGLLHVWSQGDWVSRAAFATLILMSLASWIVIVLKALDVMRAKRQAARVEGFWHSADMAEGLSKLTPQGANPFRQLVIEGREAAAHHRATKAQLHDSLDASDWISRALQGSIDSASARLQTGLAILASVGSTAPFVGLFGTVWGIMNAFVGISESQTTNLAVVAPGIAEALLATATGLVAAIPAVVVYNHLARRTTAFRAEMTDLSEGLIRTLSRDLETGRLDAAALN